MPANARKTSETILSFCVISACALFLTFCDDSGGETPGDSGTDPPVADVADDSDVAADEASGDLPPTQGTREIIASAVVRSCIGCDTVSWCGMPPRSDGTAFSMDAAPNNETGTLFAAERWEAAGRQLAVDSCALFTGAELETIVTPPNGVTVLDAGSIQLDGEMPLLDESLSCSYHNSTRNYASVVRLVDDDSPTDYLADVAMSIDAEGGGDVAAFSASATSCETVEILTPHTDESGKIDNILTDEPIHVTWTGGGDFEQIVIILETYFCPLDWTAMVMCNVANDGDFTIPSNLLGGIEWANVAELHLIRSHKVALEADGLDDGAVWSVRSEATVPIYHDPEATPTSYDCTSTHMEEGYVGNSCENDGDCGGGCCLPEVQDVYFFENYCSLLHCSDDEDCPSDAVCMDNVYVQVPWDSYCVKVCSDDSDCRSPEYACLGTESGPTACRPNFW